MRAFQFQSTLRDSQIRLVAVYTVSTPSYQGDSDKLSEKFQLDNTRGCTEVAGRSISVLRLDFSTLNMLKYAKFYKENIKFMC